MRKKIEVMSGRDRVILTFVIWVLACVPMGIYLLGKPLLAIVVSLTWIFIFGSIGSVIQSRTLKKLVELNSKKKGSR